MPTQKVRGVTRSTPRDERGRWHAAAASRAFNHPKFRPRDLPAQDLELVAQHQRVTVEAATEGLKSATASSPKIVGGLAAVDDRKLAATADRAVEIAATRGAPRILWVDDMPDNNTRERNAMTTLGMDVTTCLSTTEALDRLDRSNFDAVISDMGRRPDPQAGYTLLEAMRSRGDTTPFIIYAGSNLPEHRKLAEERGALGSTNRPQELLDLVLQAVDART
jgi:CheY-like chemotaxis protein